MLLRMDKLPHWLRNIGLGAMPEIEDSTRLVTKLDIRPGTVYPTEYSAWLYTNFVIRTGTVYKKAGYPFGPDISVHKIYA